MVTVRFLKHVKEEKRRFIIRDKIMENTNNYLYKSGKIVYNRKMHILSNYNHGIFVYLKAN